MLQICSKQFFYKRRPIKKGVRKTETQYPTLTANKKPKEINDVTQI